MKQFLVKLVSIPYCHKLFKSANFKTGSICFCTPEICVGTCRRRIHSTVLQDCLRHPLEPHLQLLEVDTSMVRVIRVPQTEESVLLLCASNEFPTHAFIQVYRALKQFSRFAAGSCTVSIHAFLAASCVFREGY